MARLYKKYKEELRDKLRDKFKYKSIMQVPKIEKIVLNMGVGRASQDKSLLDEAMRDLKLIAGQAPVSTIAKRAEASFKLREGQAIGCKVTLRGPRMYEFLDRMISISLPAVKDFRGVPVKLDGRGNYSLGWKEHTLFPEVDLNKVKHNFGMDICITTTANTDEEGRELLTGLGMPFKKNN